MILLSSRFIKKEEDRKYCVHPILRYIKDGEFHLLIKEQRDYLGWFKVYFRMSVAQFYALLAILESHIKRKNTSFCELSVQCALFCEMKRMNLTIAILHFGDTVALNLAKHFLKCLPRMQKKEIMETIQKNVWRMKLSEAVCKRDWHNARSYLFFNVQTFRTKIWDSVCDDLKCKYIFFI